MRTRSITAGSSPFMSLQPQFSSESHGCVQALNSSLSILASGLFIPLAGMVTLPFHCVRTLGGTTIVCYGPAHLGILLLSLVGLLLLTGLALLGESFPWYDWGGSGEFSKWTRCCGPGRGLRPICPCPLPPFSTLLYVMCGAYLRRGSVPALPAGWCLARARA